jgi:hypothetical protein
VRRSGWKGTVGRRKSKFKGFELERHLVDLKSIKKASQCDWIRMRIREMGHFEFEEIAWEKSQKAI